MVLAPYCREGDIRITWGNVTNEGGVEICMNEVWSRVCSNNWDQQDTSVVCRQLGYSEYGKNKSHLHNFNNYYFVMIGYGVQSVGNEAVQVFLSNVSCRGNEAEITDCRYDRSAIVSCSNNQYAGVNCNFDTARKHF